MLRQTQFPGKSSMFSLLRGYVSPQPVPLAEAEHLMDGNMHTIASVCHHYGYSDIAFRSDYQHLLQVPYSREELLWASQHNAVLTLVCGSVQRIQGRSQGQVRMDNWISQNLPKRSRHSRRPEWRLVLRPSLEATETGVVGRQPVALKRRCDFADLQTLLSMLYLDLRIFSKKGTFSRSTSTVICPHTLDARRLGVRVEDGVVKVFAERDVGREPSFQLIPYWKPRLVRDSPKP
jgi:hypothetical protein